MTCSAFLIAFGPEVRAFLHSGFVDQCAEKGRVLVLTSNPESAVFQNVPHPVLPLPQVSESPRLGRFRARAAGVAEKRLEAEGTEKWRHAMPGKKRGDGRLQWLKRGLASDPGLWLLNGYEKVLEGIGKPDAAVLALLKKHQVATLYYSAYGNPRTNAVVAAAKKAGVRTVCIPNSWKDFYIRPRISPVPDSLWVWDEDARKNYLRLNPALHSAQVEAHESLHLAAVRRRAGDLSRSQFCSLYGFDEAKPIICYTTAAPNAVVGEEKIVSDLARALATDSRLSSCQLLIRVNPMEVGRRYEEALQGMPHVAVQRPVWEWQQELDWCCALDEDVKLWAATLEHMEWNASIPSTVTLESLAFGKPVVNIFYDSNSGQPKSQSIRRFWNAPFYRRFHDDQMVACVSSIDEWVGTLKDSMKRGKA
jgi:hypothetical protein